MVEVKIVVDGLEDMTCDDCGADLSERVMALANASHWLSNHESPVCDCGTVTHVNLRWEIHGRQPQTLRAS